MLTAKGRGGWWTPSEVRLRVRRETWPLAERFAISRGSRSAAEVVVVELAARGHTGRGECVPYGRYGESVDSVVAAIEGCAGAVAAGMTRLELQQVLPAGAARNALDCAYWDLEAKRRCVPAWRLAALPAPSTVVTAFTLSLDTPGNMAAAALRHAARPLLKLKLSGDGDMERVAAVRESAPGARLVVDANEAWTAQQYGDFMETLAALGVALVEQPLPAGADEALAGLPHPVPVCADESCHTREGLADLAGRYDMVNLKLDKTGGLTEALAVRAAARSLGLGVMVGCMVGTSLAMAPAVLLAQGAEVVDLDGPLLLAADREGGLVYRGSELDPPDAGLWG